MTNVVEMTAGQSPVHAVSLLIIILTLSTHGSCQLNTEWEVCRRCNGTLHNGTALSQFCTASSGLIEGRCCMKRDNMSDDNYIIGLDLSNCSLSNVDNLQEAFTAVMIDLSLNPIDNLNDGVFEGFLKLDYVNLPFNLVCPGGNSSWEKVKVEGDNRVCRGQKNMCNQTDQMSMTCPENSVCGPYGPGLIDCNCFGNFHGYKCLREGDFPVIQVFGPLGASTVVVSLLLWVTQRRKALPG